MAVFAVNFKAAHMFFKPLGDNVDVSPSQVGVKVDVLAAQLSVSTSGRRRATPAFIWSLYESNIHFPVDEIDIWLFSCLKLHRAHEPVAVFVGLMFNAGQVEAQCVYSELPAVAWNKVISSRNRKAEINNSELKDAQKNAQQSFWFYFFLSNQQSKNPKTLHLLTQMTKRQQIPHSGSWNQQTFDTFALKMTETIHRLPRSVNRLIAAALFPTTIDLNESRIHYS